jgi:hypothetical protein
VGESLVKRLTTVALEEEDLRYIEKLVAEGRVRSFKEFVDQCVALGRIYTMDRWQIESGQFFYGPMRVAIVPQKFLAEFSYRIAESERKNLGQEFGAILKSFIFLHFEYDSTKPENRAKVLSVITRLGFGQLRQRDGEIEVVNPVLPAEVFQGLLESVLGLELSPIELAIDVCLFRIVKHK